MLTFSFLMTMALIMETVVGDNVIGDKKKKKKVIQWDTDI